MQRPTGLLSIEEKTRDQSQAAEAKILAVMLALINQYLAGFKALGRSVEFKKTDENRREQVWLFLTSRAFNSLRWAYDVLECGYYQQAAMLTRAAWEDWLCCEDSKSHSETVDALLEGEGEARVPHFQTMADRLREDLKKEWQDSTVDSEPILGAYGMLSILAHPRRFAMVTTVTELGHLRVGPAYDEDIFLMMASYVIRGMVKMLDILNILVYQTEPKWTIETNSLVEEANECKKEISDRLKKRNDTPQ